MDPMEALDKYFEEEFQLFMHGHYSKTLEEDWERFYAEPLKFPTECRHGGSPLSCSKCYFEKP